MVEVHFVDDAEIDREVGELRGRLAQESMISRELAGSSIRELIALRDSYRLSPAAQGIVDRIESLVDLRRIA